MKTFTFLKRISLSGKKNRLSVIKTILKELNIPYKTLKYSNITNIELNFTGKNSSKYFIFFAHHDISSKTVEGANDNTSSVALLLGLTAYLKTITPYYSIKIVFTDNEEMLGGLLYKNISLDNIKKIITNAGSFLYLKNFIDLDKIIYIINLEVAGIGNKIFLAKKSGNVKCNLSVNKFLETLALKHDFPYSLINVPSSDMISLKTMGIEGTVMGAYKEEYIIKQDIKTEYKTFWSYNHTEMDNINTIDIETLNMMQRFLKIIIDNLNNLMFFT